MTERKRPAALILAALVALGLGGVVACDAGGDSGDAVDGERATAGRGTVGGDAPADAATGEDGEPAVVRVWYRRGEEPVAVPRAVGGTPLTTALHELVAGPTAAERERGLTSWFSDSTRQVLRRVRLEDGFLVVDFVDLPRLIPGASSSAGSEALLASLDSTVFQFEAVDSVEYRLEGSCADFWEWLQRGCTMVRRP